MKEKDKHIAQLIKNQIKKKNPSADVILFGSRARGNAKKDSDWDILVLSKRPILKRLYKKGYKAESHKGVRTIFFKEFIKTDVFSKDSRKTLH